MPSVRAWCTALNRKPGAKARRTFLPPEPTGEGSPPRNTIALFPEQIGGEKLRFIVLDDATDSTNASKNARRFVSEDKVDLIIGSTASPPAIAIADIARQAETVQLAAAPIDLPEGKDGFTFRLPQGISLMAEGINRTRAR